MRLGIVETFFVTTLFAAATAVVIVATRPQATRICASAPSVDHGRISADYESLLQSRRLEE